ncbi:MAG: hypothetical protein J7497_10905 [Chitinophagaceae bacterium]|nr:hypothetical protein [Chitinophagaceae bacterium]
MSNNSLKIMTTLRLNIFAILSFVFLLSANISRAQSDIIRQQGCDGNPYQSIVDSLKHYYVDQGYSVLREASMTMESEYEMPIVLPMNAGSVYQFIFIGDPTSRLYEVRMYDYAEKQVVYKKNMWGDVDGNIISFNYIPQATEYHMIKPVQVNKNKKKMCGYVMLFKKNQP